MRLLVVTAVNAERDALLATLPASVRPDRPARHGDPGHLVDVRAVGVGPAAAAAGTAWLLARSRLDGTVPDAIVCAGIAGGFAGRVEVGGIVLAERSVAADLGAQDPAAPGGFLVLEELGFGRTVLDTDPRLRDRLARSLPGAVTGDVLTVSTVTGTAEATRELLRRYPRAAAEAMEGFGAAEAAALAGVPFAEIRSVSNVIGPRDRDTWRIRAALDALGAVGAALGTLVG